MVDCDAIVYELLTNGGSISGGAAFTAFDGLVDGAVRYLQTAEGFVDGAAQVVYMPEGGQGNTWAPIHERSYLFHCYGGSKTHAASQAVYRALFELLNGARNVAVSSGTFLAGWEEQCGVPVVDPATRLPLVACRFGCRMR